MGGEGNQDVRREGDRGSMSERVEPLTFGSLFAGIGGIDLGLERAGMECRWQVEVNEWARKVLARHWPNVPCYEDVRRCGAELEWVDVIAGGFPCQDLSCAGSRAGLDGERSGLWYEFARLVRILRPRYVVVENVTGLLTLGLDRVLSDLASCGYDAEWECIPAAAVGAPHIRDRVFIVGYLPNADSGGLRLQHERIRERTVSAVASTDGSTRAVADTVGGEAQSQQEGTEQAVDRWTSNGGEEGVRSDTARQQRAERRERVTARELSVSRHWAVEPGLGRVADGVPRAMDRLNGLGNAVVPQVMEFIGKCVVAHANRTM